MTSVTDKIGLAEAAALERRKQLLERKKKLENKAKGIESEESNSQEVSQDENSQSPSRLNEESQDGSEEHQEIEEKPVKPSIIDEELDLNELAPRKIDWDLKRDIESKLQILQDRTELAIAELVRDDLVEDIEL